MTDPTDRSTDPTAEWTAAWWKGYEVGHAAGSRGMPSLHPSDAARAFASTVTPAITDDGDYYPSTDYERGYADGIASVDTDRLTRALRSLVSGRTEGPDWVRFHGYAGDGLDAYESFAAQLLAALRGSR